MPTDPDVRAGRADDVLLDPGAFLADLGWGSPGAKAAAPSAPPLPSAAAPPPEPARRRYCGFCWFQLPDEAAECPDCGRSVADMDAHAAAYAEQDRSWIPPRLWQTGQAPPPTSGRAAALGQAPLVLPAASTATAPTVIALTWRQILCAVGAGGFVGGATVALAWWALQAGAPGGGPGFARPAITALAPASLTWRNPVAELRLELLAPDGRIVADSAAVDQPTVMLPAGEYQLRITDNTGLWTPALRKVIVAPAERVTLGPPSEVTAAYYLWAGKLLYDQKKYDRAERVWQKAVRHHPDGLEARLQLAALLAVRFRYRDAREQLREVLRRDPNHGEARRLMRTLDALEATR